MYYSVARFQKKVFSRLKEVFKKRSMSNSKICCAGEGYMSFFRIHEKTNACLYINYKEAEDKSALEAEYNEHKARKKASFELKSIDM